MTPEQLQQFNDMKRRLEAIERVENVPFIENLKRRVVEATLVDVTLGDLKDVNDTGITNGQLLKYNSTSGDYEPANDIDT